MAIEIDSQLIDMCINAATQNRDAVEAWRRQRRTLDCLPSYLAEALLLRLLRRRLLFPSLLEVFKNTVEKIDLRGESCVDAEWMAYLGAFRYLHTLNLADCHKINSSAIWPLAGIATLKQLDLSRCSKVTDAGIRHLLSIPTLKELSISQTGVTAEGVKLLSSLKNISMLDLGGLRITDSVLRSLQALTRLEYLDIWGSEVSNEGVAVLEMFPMLSFLNLGWTKVTKLPKLSSITNLNMSNCTIHSIFEGSGNKVQLTKLILTGATIAEESESFSHIDSNFMTFLDLSNSSVHEFCFLPGMIALEYLDLSGSYIGDDSVEMIAYIGANLRFLNLSSTKVSSSGLGILAGHVPNLESLLLSCTLTDDHAISHISAMPSLKVINLRSTYICGQIRQIGAEMDKVLTLAALQNLSFLEKLDLEETQVRDESLKPLSNFQRLNHLCLSGSLTDMCLYHLSLIRNLMHLKVRDAVLTGGGLASFCPPSTLKVLDLRGCWLLTREVLLSFCQMYPHIEVRHELYHFIPSEQGAIRHPSPLGETSKKWHSKKKERNLFMLPREFEKGILIDQRLKYSREELLALQVPTVPVPPSNGGTMTPEGSCRAME